MGENELEPVDTITPYQAGKVLHKNAEAIRTGLKQGIFPFGSAIPPEEPGGNWNYIIIKSKFMEYAGILNKKGVSENED